MKRFLLRSIVLINGRSKSAAVRLTKITGKSPVPIHPKHLLPENKNKHWYLETHENWSCE